MKNACARCGYRERDGKDPLCQPCRTSHLAWTPVVHTIPLDGVPVLATLSDRTVKEAFRRDGFWFVDGGKRLTDRHVTHWQPLPLPAEPDNSQVL